MQDDWQEADLALIFNKQVYSLEVTWMEGYAHGELEVSSEFNPFDRQTKPYHYWQEGWESGFLGEEALFPEYRVEIDPVVAVISKDRGSAFINERFDQLLFSLGAFVGTAAIITAVLVDVAA
jgi:hypothetical protein